MSAAMPISHHRRLIAYNETNGVRNRLTARQRRRLQHKRNHAAAPFGKKVKGE